MPELTLLQNYLILGAMLFGIGLVGFASRRNMIVMFLSAEMMLQGVSLSLVAWGRWHNDFGGQMLVVFIIAVAACEAAVALALILVMFRRRGSLDIMLWHDLREDNQTPPTDALVWDLPAPAPNWPRLPTAGRRPELPQEDTDYRPNV
jgi:NADH-quinone oxidoreductase subunit K